MNLVYTDGNFNIYEIFAGRGKGRKEFILHNTAKRFPEGHSHLKSFKTAKYLIKLCRHKSLPRHLSNYLLISLYRISDDEQYRARLKALADNKSDTESHTKRYVNEAWEYRRANKRESRKNLNRKWGG